MNAAPSLHPTDQTLHAYGLGKLGADAATSVDAHLTECSDCRRRVAELSGDSSLNRLRVEGLTERAAMNRERNEAPAAHAQWGELPSELAAQYELVRELGRGGMGVVWLARNKLLDRLEALKILNREMLERGGTLDRFLREMRVVAQLNHENVVRAYSALQFGRSLVFVLEYVEGFDLAKLVKQRGPLPVQHACYFVSQAALGLQHAHERGMVHRDIKPGNLILNKQGHRAIVKVLDFGLAKALSEQAVDGGLTHEGQMLGTPDYVAPEQTLDAQKADIRADIYSLGCTLYYLLSGGPPFQGTSLYELLQAHHSVDARSLNFARPEVPAELAAVVARMMAKDPLRRFQTPREVSHALTPYFKPGAVAAKAEPPPSPVERAAPIEPLAPREAEPRWQSLIEFKETARSVPPPKPLEPTPVPPPLPVKRPPWIGAALAAALSLVGALVAWFVIVKVMTPEGCIVIDGMPQASVVTVDGSTVNLEWPGEQGPARAKLAVGAHKIKVMFNGAEIHGEEVTIATGKERPIKVIWGPAGSLFNGRDLTGWTDLLPNGSRWDVVNGTIEGRGGGADHPGVLVLSDGRFTNFKLRFKARYSRPGGGWVELRRTASGRSGENSSCYVVKHAVLPAEAGDLDSAGTVGRARNYVYGTRFRGELQGSGSPLALDRWHAFEIVVDNSRIKTSIDGAVVSDLADADELYPSGTIAFGVNGPDAVQFRDVEVVELPDPTARGERPKIQGRFAALFNGKDLSGWFDLLPNGSQWTVVDDAIEGKGGGRGNPGVLVLTDRRFTDFRLRFQVRYPNNGFGWVELRRAGKTATDGCYGVAHAVLPGYVPVGSVIRMRNSRYGESATWDYQPARVPFPTNTWHKFDILVVKNRITTSVDGTVVSDYVDSDAMHAAGTIALASGAVDTLVQYKEILIDERPADGSANVPNSAGRRP